MTQLSSPLAWPRFGLVFSPSGERRGRTDWRSVLRTTSGANKATTDELSVRGDKNNRATPKEPRPSCIAFLRALERIASRVTLMLSGRREPPRGGRRSRQAGGSQAGRRGSEFGSRRSGHYFNELISAELTFAQRAVLSKARHVLVLLQSRHVLYRGAVRPRRVVSVVEK